MTTRLEFNALPSVVHIFFKALISRRPSLLKAGETVGRIEAGIRELTADPDRLASYNVLCNFPESEHLPPPFPHILAFPLQLAILSSEAFPIRLPGLVHVANRIVQHEPVPLQEPLGIECSVEGHRETERGQEFELLTECEADGRKVWEESSTYLARRRSTAKKTKSKAPAEDAEAGGSGARIVSWEAPANIGRRYAKVSGDFNPIHLSAPTARILGFPGAIAHGMWTMARCAAELECDWKALCLEVQFKLPVFLPAWVCLHSSGDSREISFRLTDSGGEKPHLEGRLSRLGS